MSKNLGIWASSSPAKSTEYTKGIKILKKWGLNLIIPENVSRHACKKLSPALPFLAGADEKKLQSLQELWSNPRVEKIMAVRGGAGSLRLIKHLDASSFLSKGEKEIWGFSDLTSIQNYLYLKHGYRWVHAPMVTSNALLDANAQELRAWKEALSGKSGSQQIKIKRLVSAPKSKNSLSIKGKIFGGNLSCFTTLVGSSADISRPENKILFLEEVNERDYRIDRVLTHLSHSKMFSGVESVVLGHFTNCPKFKGVVCEWAKRVGVGLFAGVKSGHDRPNLPLRMGDWTRIELDSQNSAILELPAPSLG